MDGYMPDYCLGIDIETKGVEANTQILSIASVLMCIRKLKVIGCINLVLDRNDPDQVNRSVCDRTLKWWADAGTSDRHPSVKARDITWSGTLTLEKSLHQFNDFIKMIPRNMETVIPMKGPDFDYVILKNAFSEFGIKDSLRASPLDSVRTVERMYKTLDIPLEPTLDELLHFNKSGKLIEHTALADAGLECYQTAKLYHFLHLIKTKGYGEAMKNLNDWQKGEFPNHD